MRRFESRSAGSRVAGLSRLAGLSALFALQSCALFRSPYDLEMAAHQMDKVVSVFLVVTEEGNLEGWDDEDKRKDLVAPANQSKALTFVQFQPEKRGSVWDFKDLGATTTDPGIEYEASEDEPVIFVEIDRDLLESQPELAAAVVINGLEGWDAVLVRSSEIKSSDGHRVEVRSKLRKKALD